LVRGSGSSFRFVVPVRRSGSPSDFDAFALCRDNAINSKDHTMLAAA
jgi:hypothetical protein